MTGPDLPVLFVAGPTASGKTRLAVRAAAAIDGEVVNADSMQLYRDIPVLSAQPGEAERGGVPHHLFGALDAAVRASVGWWLDEALRLITEIRARGRTPVFAGGTGLYFNALTEGLAPVPAIGPEARRRAAALADDVEALRAEAERLDPDAAARVLGADRHRLLRIVEVAYETGRPLSALRSQTRPALAPDAWFGVVIEPDRAELYARIDARFDAMLDAGALDEARALAARGLPASLPAMKALGAPQLIAAAEGRMSLAEAAAAARQETRRYAKRQLTWFRNRCAAWPRIRTLDPEAAWDAFLDAAPLPPAAKDAAP